MIMKSKPIRFVKEGRRKSNWRAFYTSIKWSKNKIYYKKMNQSGRQCHCLKNRNSV